jgi:endonuclease/exonuclease/phosphatase family metal-dependent hydrolase
VAQRVNALKTTLPVLLVGDFNAVARANKAYDILTGEGGFTDTRFSAARRVGEDFATFHGYKPPTPNGPHIDWILSRGAVTTHETEVVAFQQGGQYPSDHFPVAATVTLGEAATATREK